MSDTIIFNLCLYFIILFSLRKHFSYLKKITIIYIVIFLLEIIEAIKEFFAFVIAYFFYKNVNFGKNSL